jgi:AraC-like DNA-binding protein
MDRLSPFFSHFSLSARIFFSGTLCGTSSDHITKTAGHLHVLRRGKITIFEPGEAPHHIEEPSVLLYPRPGEHTFRSDGADIVCAFVEFGAGMLNPLASALPKLLKVPLAAAPPLVPTAETLFEEAFGSKDGRQVAVDRLAEYFLVLLLRFAIDAQIMKGGILTGLSDPHLSPVLAAFHREPEKAWSLEELAHVGGMSRARFAAHFLNTMGQTPFEYLTQWRIGVAQSLLKRGEPLKMVAPAVGYSSTGALTRSFSLIVGKPPMAWLATQVRGNGMCNDKA